MTIQMNKCKLVPVEPTPEMIDAAREHHEGEAYLPVSLYKAMIAAAPAGQGEPAAHTFYVLHDSTEGQKYIKKDIDGGCLMIFESEEDARRAKRQHSGTECRFMKQYLNMHTRNPAMTSDNRCGQWDNEHRRCMSGHIRTSPICWGAANSRVVPQCLTDDPPRHLIRGDGMPLGWPEAKQEPVAWLVRARLYCGDVTTDRDAAEHWEERQPGSTTPLYTAPQPAKQQECGCCGQTDRCDDDCDAVVVGGHRATEQQPTNCVGCEGKPKPGDTPCAVCGLHLVPPAPDVSQLVEALQAADEYLSNNKLNQIGSGSILHRQMQDALAAHRKQEANHGNQ